MSDGNPDSNGRSTIGENIRGLFSKLKKSSPQEEFEEDIMTMVNEGQETGVIQDREARMISNIFALDDKEAQDIMTHRSQIIGISADTLLEDARNFMLDESYSRFPVYEENIDHVIGVLNLKDVCRTYRQEETRSMPIKEIPGLIRDAVYTAETKKIDALFREMQRDKVQMVVVIDEYGQTAGLVAMEDILEEIVGNIQDEYDADEMMIQEKGKDKFIIDGMSRLEELEERFHIHFHEETFDTLNGFLISKMDKIPEPGDQYTAVVEGYEFKVMKVKNHKIEKVIVRKLDETEQELEK